MYQVFSHTADAGLRIEADSMESLLEDAARGLFSLIVSDLDGIEASQREEFRIPGDDPAYLLFDWLNELLFAFDSRAMLFRTFEVSMEDEGIRAVVAGEPIDREKHQLEHEVKAITYHGLSVIENGGKWSAEVIVDI